MSRQFEDLSISREGPVAWLQIERPAVLNTLRIRTLEEIIEAVAELEADTDVAVVVVTGAGARAFSAGIHVDEMVDMDAVACDSFTRLESKAYRSLLLLQKPSIAAVNGYALGGGCVLALVCDIRVAAENAVFGLTELKMGAPVPIEAALLPLLIGHGRAREIVYTARHVTAAEANSIGLCTSVVAPDELRSFSHRLATEIAGHDSVALRAQKDIVTKWMTSDLLTASDYSIAATSVVFASGAPHRAIEQFLATRRARNAATRRPEEGRSDA